MGIKLTGAKICVNCEEVFSYKKSVSGIFPSCGSEATCWLRSWVPPVPHPPINKAPADSPAMASLS